jgi:hypothetical protein
LQIVINQIKRSPKYPDECGGRHRPKGVPLKENAYWVSDGLQGWEDYWLEQSPEWPDGKGVPWQGVIKYRELPRE